MSPAVPLEPTPQRRRHPGSGGIVAVRSRWAGGSPHPRYRVRLHDPGRSGRLLFDATFATQAEARRALAQVQALAILGEPVPDPRRRVGPLLDAYEAAIRAQRRPRAYLATEHHLRRWVRPYFAAMTLQQMNSAAELRGFLTWLRSQTSDFTHRPLKVSTMRHIVQVVSSFLEMCLQEGHIRRNAARGEFMGRRELRESRRPNLPGAVRGWRSVAEARRYQAAAFALSYGDLCVFILQTCLRSAEARGLLWENVHLDAEPPCIDVLTQLVLRDRPPPQTGRTAPNPRGGGRGQALVLSPELKTGAAYRSIVLSPLAAAILQRRLDTRAARRQAAPPGRWDDRYDLVFRTTMGTPISGGQLLRSHTAICARAGVRPIGVHGLRHTGLSLLIAGGVPLEDVRRIAGHNSLRELEEVYLYSLYEFAGRGATAMGELLPLVSLLPEARTSG